MLPIVLIVALFASVLNANRRFGTAELAMIAPRLAALIALLFLAAPLDISLVAWAMPHGLWSSAGATFAALTLVVGLKLVVYLVAAVGLGLDQPAELLQLINQRSRRGVELEAKRKLPR